MNRNPALESASARIVSLAIPKLSCAMVPNRSATVDAEINNDKMEVITRPCKHNSRILRYGLGMVLAASIKLTHYRPPIALRLAISNSAGPRVSLLTR
jgi:hypothetical protein